MVHINSKVPNKKSAVQIKHPQKIAPKQKKISGITNISSTYIYVYF